LRLPVDSRGSARAEIGLPSNARASATDVNEALWCFPAVVFPGGVR